ncbi:uncharacterized protein I206_103709 [Kwoniella pini CBS 10737]|uniref:Major facilitator superfamily (MFS) profile domain-containing protein n=1 Tax=Kwoniella pini CBS 10737 TaxID=1296096 RepID=A0A1B9I911_9TREE|nr:uncharacterized protein I206_01290 [Kwoniella pini CBS 10737]OCF52006.1 hypothetical protein I206_01290 [Kwoniella pini CBS 10737]
MAEIKTPQIESPDFTDKNDLPSESYPELVPLTSTELTDEQRREERQFVWRLDLSLLVIGFLGYAFKYIDQQNISNAYVSGMKEDLNIVGNQYNYFTVLFNAGYIIMLWPSCILVSRIGPSKWLPFCEVMWGIFTCCLALSKNYRTIYGLRFLVGFFEGSAWPGYMTIISQWYLPHEIALRMSLYNIAQPVGAMLSGAMQGALSTNLEGHGGKAGWQWAFIVNGVCTIAIALAAFFVLPGYPERPNPLAGWYMKEKHIAIALRRNARVNRSGQRPITVKSFLNVFRNWKVWAFGLAWVLGGCTTPSGFFNLWLKSLKLPNGKARYSVAQLNYLPIAGQAISLGLQVIFSSISDYTGNRIGFLLLHFALNFTSEIILIIRPSNYHTYMAGWYLNYCGFAAMLIICGWASTVLADQPEARTVLFASGTLLAYILSAFVPLAAFPASEAPNWRIGAKLYLGFCLVGLALYLIIYFGLQYENKRKIKKSQEGKRQVA